MTMEPGSMSRLDAVLQSGRLVICAGPGGVGKTTTSAAIGLQAALAGRRVIVLTIDPARRLANSLGLESLTNDPQRIDLVRLRDEKDAENTGALWAMMLDQKQTLDDLVARFAPDIGAAKRSHGNNIYRLLSSALHGMQEYMALDKLHDLYTGGEFDLVVLDTPPTKNALEFLETPGRARQFFDDRVIKWLLPPKEKSGFLARVFNPGNVVSKLLARLFGQDFVDDLVEFFDTLQFLQEALRSRGEMIDFILREESTHFLIVTNADPQRIREAEFFHDKLGTLHKKATAFVLNRVIPPFRMDDVAAVDDKEPTLGLEDSDWEWLLGLRSELTSHYEVLARYAEYNREIIARLADRVGDEAIRTVPLLGEDVHDLSQLERLGTFLLGEPASTR